MANKIRIFAGEAVLPALLYENQTSDAIWETLPLEAFAQRWGDEIYFPIPVDLREASDARQEMAVGELGYWPEGKSFCIFFGPTPVSEDSIPRAFSNVNPFGRIEGQASMLRSVAEGAKVRVERFSG